MTLQLIKTVNECSIKNNNMKLTVFYLILTIEIAYCFNCNYVYGYFNCDYYTWKEGNPKTVQSKSFLKGIDTVTNFTINPISDPISI